MNKNFMLTLILFNMSIKSKISLSQLISATVTKQEVLSINDMKFGDSLTPSSVVTSLKLIKLLPFWQYVSVKGEKTVKMIIARDVKEY